MLRAILISLASLGLSVTAHAGPLRQVAETFSDAAPDQDTLHELLAPAPAKDEDDKASARAARLQRIGELEQEYAGAKSEITRAAALYDLAKLHEERAFDLRDQAERAFKVDHDRWWIGELAAEPELESTATRKRC